MKKVAAFSVFKSKKDKPETPGLQRNGSARGSLKKASSVPTIPSDQKKAKSLVKAFKSGSFRQTMRSQVKRPKLSDGLGNSPFVAGDKEKVKLTKVKSDKKSPAAAKKSPQNNSKSDSWSSASSTESPTKAKKGRKSYANSTGLQPVLPSSRAETRKTERASSSLSSNSLNTSPSKRGHGSKQSNIDAQAESLSKGKKGQKLSVYYNDFATESQTPTRGKKAINGHSKSPPKNVSFESLPSVFDETPKTGKRKRDKGVGKMAASPKQNKPLPLVPRSDMPLTVGKRPLEDSTTSRSKKKKLNPAPTQYVGPVMQVSSGMMSYMYDSAFEATKVFECMIHPVVPAKFFKDLWQKKPLLVKRHVATYNDGWFSTAELDRLLREENIKFGVNLDVTTYKDGKRETHNPPGRAYPPIVWDFFQNGCSVRLLNPQTYSTNVWKMLSTLQEYFGCCVGANIYLTPPGTQGFAPHYDDIEAFILQLEGKKHWRLYSPRTQEETLPRLSSGNFTSEGLGEPILDVTLVPGDLLYFPRGTIHQGHTLEDAHSLHITVSCYQKNTWGDLLEKLVPRALQIAIEEDVEFREGLPRDYLNYMGLVNSEVESSDRLEFMHKVSSLLTKMIQNYSPVDASCDQMGKQFVHDSLPPVLTESERMCSIHGSGETWDQSVKQVRGTVEIEPDTTIKIIRKGIIRLITEEEAVRIYHSLENARVYHGSELQYIEINAEAAPCVEYLIQSYPEFVSVDSLPLPTSDERVGVASMLYDNGLLMTGEPLVPLDEESDILSDMDDSDVA